MTTRLSLLAAVWVLACLPRATFAELGDVTIRTDHPIYPGEGAFQEIEDCVRFATLGKTTSQDKAIALYQWLLTHQYHLMSPQECAFPGEQVDTNNSGEDRIVYDANRARFSYGYGLCGTVHAWNEPYWRALGMPARRRAFPGHTNSEVYYDGSWHAFDTDMAGLLFRRDGVVAGYEDIMADPGLIMAVKPPLPHYPFAWPGDFDAMKAGWKEVAKGGEWFKLYNGGFAAHPGIVRLRAGETWTRWFDRDHYGGPDHRRFWHHGKGGPDRVWTFVNTGDTRHDGPTSKARGNASYCNGDFVYSPPLDQQSFREGVVRSSDNLGSRPQSPRLHSTDRQATEVIFAHHSPYVICGRPVDGKNPMTGKATDGLIIRATVVGDVTCRISVDSGQTWTDARWERATDSPVVGDSPDRQFLQLDATEIVKGHYGWWVAFDWRDHAGIDELTFETTTQVSQSIYPRLKPAGSDVTLGVASRGVIPFSPNFALPPSQADVFEVVPMRSSNLVYQGVASGSRLAYETTDNKPANLVLQLNPNGQTITELRAAIRYSLRSPTPPGASFAMDVSTDLGTTWQRFSESEIAEDNEFSSGWLAGRALIQDAGNLPVYVRVHLYGGGYRTGLLQANLYGIHRTGPPQNTTLTYGWKENNELKTWTRTFTPVEMQTFHIPTGIQIEDSFIRLEVPR